MTSVVIALLFAPLLPGIINRTKAFFAGRSGQSPFQLYYDLWKLLHKGAVYSTTTTWVFWAGPVIGLAAVIVALLFVPFGGIPAVYSFSGDFLLLLYLLALGRFFLVLAALDTGSAFEGMGASREVFFAMLAEVAIFLVFVFLVSLTGEMSLQAILTEMSRSRNTALVETMLVSGSIFFVLLVENSRIPIDDPNTHLELTMIHEVMILDHSGPDLALIEYASSLKLWLFSLIFLQVFLPIHSSGGLVPALGLILTAVVVGVVESTVARLRLTRVPQFIAGAWALGALGIILYVVRVARLG